MIPRYNPERSLGKVLSDEETSSTNSANVTEIAYHAEVVNNDDPKNSKRIQVRIETVDFSTLDDDLPW